MEYNFEDLVIASGFIIYTGLLQILALQLAHVATSSYITGKLFTIKIQDYTNNLASVGIELENQSIYHLNKRKSNTQIFQDGRNNEFQNHFYLFLAHNFSRWSVKECEILMEMLKNELLRKEAQCVYVRVNCERLKDVTVKMAYNQFKQKAIQQFNKLGRNLQIQYLAYYLQETMQIFDNLEGTQRSFKPFDSHFGELQNLSAQGVRFLQNGTYLQGINFSFLSSFARYGSNEYLAREYSRQALYFGQNEGMKGQGKQGINSQYNQGDAKNKNDIYRMALANRGSQKEQKQNNKGDESKQKAQFQTLKSLFKKLQNNT